jgi:hypothetical protein
MNVSAPIAGIGHNQPPEPMTAFEAVKINITDLYEEARQWLDGTPVETQEQADAINTLKATIRDAIKAAEEQRVKEKAPLDEQIAEIQARYNELIGSNKSVTGLAIKAEQACNAALKPYLLKLAEQQAEATRIAQEAAAKAQAEAAEAVRQRDAANLESREAAEAKIRAAQMAEEAAKRAEKAKAHAKGDGRATGLRTVYRAEMTDFKAAAAWTWKERNEELRAWVQEQADKAVRDQKLRSIPGFNIIEEKVL